MPAGQTPHVKYAEGVFLGYRYYTSMNKQPLFPFGFGMSYTTFAFSNLNVSPDFAPADGPITVSFDVTILVHVQERQSHNYMSVTHRQRSSGRSKN